MIEYIVNKDKRTVVAMIKFVDEEGDTPETFKDSLRNFESLWMTLKRLEHSYNYYNKEYYNKASKMFFPKYMSAKAKCDPHDEWDEEYGKKLARERLVEKIHDYRGKSYYIVAELADKIYRNLIG
jgi:hypothetical protein